MLINFRRLKRTYVKFFFVSLVICLIIIYVKLLNSTAELSAEPQIQLTKETLEYERILSEWESKVIPNLGDGGKFAELTGRDKIEGEKSLKKMALNTVLSDRMPMNRTLKDPRHVKCRTKVYNPQLQASIIVIFYNELPSVILRTVWSVILQSPKHLLKEIILVDDCSTDEPLKGQLQYYIDTRLKGHDIKIVRLPHRLGLIRARLQGARKATGDVLIFLDAHCEATVGWMEPLLSRIEEDRTAVLVPIIDVIEAKDFSYATNGDSYQVGGFSWSGHFTWINIQEGEDEESLGPVRSPTMAGGLFAIERKYFWDIGSYDEQMDGWGGENLELSFRIWMCGGRLETVPCSRVGHVFRDFHPYSFPNNKDTHGINTARLVEVWLDDYKRLYYSHAPNLKDNPIIGDLTHRKQLRQKLRCKSFRWFLNNIYPEQFIPDENCMAHGQVRNGYDACLDDLQLAEGKVGPLGIYQCHPYVSVSQDFTLNFRGELRTENFCAEGFSNGKVQLTECHHHNREQYWKYFKNGTIYNPTFDKCLSSENVGDSQGLKLDSCRKSDHQTWKFTYPNQTALIV